VSADPFVVWLLDYVNGTEGTANETLTTVRCGGCNEGRAAGFVWRHETFGLLFETVPRQSRRHQFAKLAGLPLDSPGVVGIPSWRSSRMVVQLSMLRTPVWLCHAPDDTNVSPDTATIVTTCRKGHVQAVDAATLIQNALAGKANTPSTSAA